MSTILQIPSITGLTPMPFCDKHQHAFVRVCSLCSTERMQNGSQLPYHEMKARFGKHLTYLMQVRNLEPNDIYERSTQSAMNGGTRPGISREAVYGYMQGKSLPLQFTADTLANLMGITLEELTPEGVVFPDAKGRSIYVPQSRAPVRLKLRRHSGLQKMSLSFKGILPVKLALALSKALQSQLEKQGIAVDADIQE